MSSSPSFPGFTPDTVRFLRGLKRNNNKPWFEAHRDEYESNVKRPLQLFVEEFDARLGEFAPELVGNPKRSIFRIYRDIRFSKDKSPYKTVASCWFYHRDVGHGVGQHTHGGAGFYFQIAPNESFIAAGIWMPPPATLKRLREEIAENHSAFAKVLSDPAFRRTFGPLNSEDMLTRPPRGYSPEHPAVPLLLHKSYMVSRDLTEKEIYGPKLLDVATKAYSKALPFVRWLNSALGYSPVRRR